MKKILIADDAEFNRDILKDIFEEQFEVMEAVDGEEALEIISDNINNLSLILLDLMMPKKSGLDVLSEMKLKGYIDSIPVIMITGESTTEIDVQAFEYGVSDIIYKPFSRRIVTRRALNVIELFEHRIYIEKQLESRTAELIASQQQIAKNNEFLINALSSVIEFRSLESGSHIKRVQKFTEIILKHLMALYPETGFTKNEINQMVKASALHDIGKIGIPDEILLKPGKLTKDEYEIMKTHTTVGCDILEKFRQEDSQFYKYCYDICRFHHERYDGNGYPDRLKADEIPLWAQVVSIVDVYDALISPRVYKLPYEPNLACKMIHEGECGVFNPMIVKCFDAAKFELFKAFDEIGS